jgi:rare lipoprotein A
MKTLLTALLPSLALLALAGCASTPAPAPVRDVTVDPPKAPVSTQATPTRKPKVVLKRGGGFYKDDGPGDDIPDGLDDIPEPQPRWEPLHKPATRPYVVLGQQYVPNTTLRPYKARGIASWYGRKFHGQKTSVGEIYDMFGLTAAHPTLALPSYVRVTSLENGRSIVVRVNDRGPFHAGRIIDLSYTAAYRLGLIDGGSGMVEVEAIIPGEPAGTTYADLTPPPRPVSPPPAVPVTPSAPASGVFVQLGAFASADNAENLKNHLMRELEWLRDPILIQAGDKIHRVQMGPYPTRAAADQVAERIGAALGFKPTIVVR